MVYDKRGSGRSGGDFETATYADFINDAIAAVGMLRARDDIVADQIGLLGTSESGWLTPEIAKRAGGISFIINRAGPPISWIDTNLWEIRNELIEAGLRDEKEIAEFLGVRERIWRYYEAAATAKDPLPALRAELELERVGIKIVDRRLGSDVFNEASLGMPDGQMIRLLEARTFSPSQRAPGEVSRLGWFEEFALPVADRRQAQRQWELLGFVPAEEGDEPYPHVGLTSDSLNVALLQAGFLSRPALTFADAAMPARIAELADAGIEFERKLPGSLDPSRHALLVAPEGTQLLLTTTE